MQTRMSGGPPAVWKTVLVPSEVDVEEAEVVVDELEEDIVS